MGALGDDMAVSTLLGTWSAQGQPVTVRLEWLADTLRVDVANPLAGMPQRASALVASGGGHGLMGMRERFAALPLGGSVDARVEGSAFVVDAEARLR